jgi:hypothetical protein
VYKLQARAEAAIREYGGVLVELVEEPAALRGGDRVWWQGGEIRIMALADGYAMVRRLGALPFVVAVADLQRESRGC